MDKLIVTKLKKTFEEYVHKADGVEFWFARDLQGLLDYDEWRNFINVIEKAKIACRNSGQQIADHFVGVNKTIPMPKGASKETADCLF
jgi:DNA-damage-inducible protein D